MKWKVKLTLTLTLTLTLMEGEASVRSRGSTKEPYFNGCEALPDADREGEKWELRRAVEGTDETILCG